MHPWSGTIGIVLGYHGTTDDCVAGILADGFTFSNNPYDWLGRGIYFFQDGAGHALAYAKKYCSGGDPCVIRAELDLDQEGFLDFFDRPAKELFVRESEAFEAALGAETFARFRQTESIHAADCAIFNFMYANLAQRGKPVRVARCLFAAGGPAWRTPDRRKESAVPALGHVQIVVRDPSVIVGEPIVFEMSS